MIDEHHRHMNLAIRLARRGLGRTRPNPPVGAVVARGGRVLGRGFHRLAGAPHAEIEALRQAGERARGATLYVTLEPCAHFGRTPPCVDAVRAAGIRRVFIGARDPNPRSGNGVRLLRRAGIAVETGLLGAECAELIGAFRKAVLTGLPWVALKLAASLDGRIATRDGDSRWVTGEAVRRLVHRWRNQYDAVLVGCETVRRDDPELTCRRRGGRDPVRIVLDGRLRVPLGARIVSGSAAAGTVVITAAAPTARKARVLRARGVTLLHLPSRDGRISLRRALRALCRRDVHSVLIEGGGQVAAAALGEQVVDRLHLFYAPKLVGGDGRPMVHNLGVERMSAAVLVRIDSIRHVGTDLLLEASPAWGRARSRSGSGPA